MSRMTLQFCTPEFGVDCARPMATAVTTIKELHAMQKDINIAKLIVLQKGGVLVLLCGLGGDGCACSVAGGWLTPLFVRVCVVVFFSCCALCAPGTPLCAQRV